MALITCDECGGTVSTKAVACPHCRVPVVISDNIEDTTTRPEGKAGTPTAVVYPVYYVGIAMDVSEALLEMANPKPM